MLWSFWSTIFQWMVTSTRRISNIMSPHVNFFSHGHPNTLDRDLISELDLHRIPLWILLIIAAVGGSEPTVSVSTYFENPPEDPLCITVILHTQSAVFMEFDIWKTINTNLFGNRWATDVPLPFIIWYRERELSEESFFVSPKSWRSVEV